MERIARIIASEMVRYNVIADDEDVYECYVYGLQLAFSSILIFVVMLFLAAISGNIVECILFAVFFCPLRAFAGGYHCKKYFSCFFLSITFWIILAVLLHLSAYSYTVVSAAVFAVAALYILFNAPMEHNNKPLSEAEMRSNRKFVIVLLLLQSVCYLFLLKLALYSFAFILGYSMAVITILMITERLGGVKNEKSLPEDCC